MLQRCWRDAPSSGLHSGQLNQNCRLLSTRCATSDHVYMPAQSQLAASFVQKLPQPLSMTKLPSLPCKFQPKNSIICMVQGGAGAGRESSEIMHAIKPMLS